ncbi:MAG: cytochrome c [Candidatus Eremiobacteraeota bacterium]|nr:cytochrome c [Candidatus Eremiobacteraeota bacterium]
MTFNHSRVLLLASTLALAGLLHHGVVAVAADAPDGKAIYTGKCVSCHKANGAGLPGAFPALAGNKNVTAADPSGMVASIKNGKGSMPAWKGQLSNAQIAAVATYVRSSWGNKASAVTEKDVAAVK